MTVKEMVAKLGLDFDAQSFLKAEVAFKLIEGAADFLKERLEEVAEVFEKAIIGTAEEAHHLELLSQEIGVSTEKLQEMAYAGSLNGLSLDDMAGSLGKLSRTIKAASQGGAEQMYALAQAGVRHMGSLDEALEDVAERFKTMPDGPKKTALAMDLFGRSGKQLIPLLNKGRDGLAELREEAHELGVVMSEEDVEAGADLSAQIIKLKAFGEGLLKTLGGPLIEALVPVAKGFLAWAKANREVIKSGIQRAVNALVVSVRGLVAVLGFLARNLKFIATVVASVLLPVLFAQIGALATTASWYVALGVQAVASAARAAVAWLAAAAPFVLIAALITAIVLAIDDVYTYLEGGDSLIGEIGPKWTKFLDDFSAPRKEDPWWLEMLRNGVGFVSDLDKTWPRAMDELRDAFADFFSWVVENATKVGQFVLSSLTGGIYKGDADTAFLAGAGARKLFERNAGLLGAATGLPFASVPETAPPATSLPAGAGTVLAPSTTIVVNAAPGQSEHEIAKEGQKQYEEWFNGLLQEAAGTAE